MAARGRKVRAAWAVLVGIAGLAGGAAAQGAAPAAAPPPAELFFSDADLANVVLSPSGKRLAAITTPAGGRPSLAIVELEGPVKAATVAGFVDADVDEAHWVNEDRLVFSVADPGRGSGDRQLFGGLFSVKRDGSEQRLLVRAEYRSFVEGERHHGREPLDANHVLLHVPDGGGSEVVVGEYQFAANGDFREVLPRRLDVATGRARRIEGLPDVRGRDWMFDAEGRPLLVVHGDAGRREIRAAEAGGGNWRRVVEYDALRAPFTPRFVDADGSVFAAVPRGRGGTAELARLDLARGEAQASLVAAPGFDLRPSPVREGAGGRILGVRIHTDAESTVWFDPAMAALQKEVDQRLPGRVNRLSCRRCASPERVLLVYSYSDQDPGRFFVVQDGGQRWRELGARVKGLNPAAMAQTDFVRIQARDGRELPLWVTAPARAKGPLPAVVLVHGGPWVRGGDWQWSGLRQFLATRGYLVIEPEFRGSTGYGVDHFRAGFRQWGLAMQDDLADALQWAVKQGRAAPDRSCIAGGSYGGYAALMGPVRHPELYRCAAAWAAVSDPRLLFEWSPTSDMPDEARLYSLREMIGDPVADAEALNAATPLAQAARIKRPVLLVHGNEDRRVPIAHGTKMRDALRSAGNEPEWVVYGGEGHGWAKPENRIDFARRLEAFLAKHLAPRAP